MVLVAAPPNGRRVFPPPCCDSCFPRTIPRRDDGRQALLQVGRVGLQHEGGGVGKRTGLRNKHLDSSIALAVMDC
jgi:hypothetical protein